MVTRRAFLLAVGVAAIAAHATAGFAAVQTPRKTKPTKLATTTLTISGML